MTVFANGLEVACKAQSNKVIAAFPYVCMTPPQTPATPPGVPVPYPTFALDDDTDKGTGTVKIGGGTVTQKNLSYYSKCTGNEAGCAPMKNVVSHVNTGKDYAHAWSGNVKMDGEPVSRFTDLATNDHASPMAGGPPQIDASTANPAVVNTPEPPKCPCCNQAAHANQLKADGTLLDTIPEAEFYGERRARADAKIQGIQAREMAGDATLSRDAIAGAWKQYHTRRNAHQTLVDARANGSPCPNLHEEDKECGVHFKDAPSVSEILERENPAEARRIEAKHAGIADPKKRSHSINRAKHNFVREDILGCTDSIKKTVIREDGKGTGVNKGVVHHKTPISAGGCPSDRKNLIGQGALTPDCDAINMAQDVLQKIEEV